MVEAGGIVGMGADNSSSSAVGKCVSLAGVNLVCCGIDEDRGFGT